MTMGRKSLVVCHADHRFEQSRDAMWTTMCRLGEFTRHCVADSLHIHSDTVKSYLVGLIEHGYVEHLDRKDREARYQRRWYRVTRTQRDTPRFNKQGQPLDRATVQDSIWRNLPIQKAFTTRQMFMVVNTERTPTTLNTVKRYLCYLHSAGYLAKRGKGPRSSWVFIAARWSGPKPPQILRTHQVWDANQQRIVWDESQETTHAQPN